MKAFALLAFAALLSGCQSLQGSPSSAPIHKTASANGATMTYVEQGTGAPVLFVHGAYSDHRIWEPQRETVAARYRFIAIHQRYFGTAPWPDNGSQFSQATHVADLAAFIRELNAGPVHLVGRSYGATIALTTAVLYPQLIRSVFAHEAQIVSLVTDDSVRKAVIADRKGLAAVSATAKAGNAVEATKLFHEYVNDSPGSFDKLAPSVRAMAIDNARTVVLQVSAPPPAPITCAEFGELKMPVALSKGELTRSSFKALVEAQQRCLPRARVVTIPGATHGAPGQNPVAFNEAVLAFLAGN